MTPDPSGAARAPQPLAELLAEVRGELAKTFSSDPNVCFPAASAIEKNAREWLGALVQAVEDQQRQLDGLDRSGWVGLLKCCSGPITKGGVRLHFDSCPDKCSAEVTRLRGEVAQLRADGQRLRELLGRIAEKHSGCEDGFYACPKSEDYFGSFADDETPIEKRPCYCWADPAREALGGAP